jgi:hypothetical protein
MHLLTDFEDVLPSACRECGWHEAQIAKTVSFLHCSGYRKVSVETAYDRVDRLAVRPGEVNE